MLGIPTNNPFKKLTYEAQKLRDILNEYIRNGCPQPRAIGTKIDALPKESIASRHAQKR